MFIIDCRNTEGMGAIGVSKALYRKYRSKSLDEIIGQKHITDILSRAVASGNISHAYLLTGPRGVGKTSVARILAYAINGLPYDEEKTNLDIIEIDAASNNGVEDVRDLREKVQIAPVSAKKKVYIIDEVHMLSKPAFNALLKTLEEPPEHIVFILATTNVEKLPATIISRAQRFSFRPIGVEDSVKHLRNIADKENIKIEDDALSLIARHSDGSFRDSISLLDQLSGLVEAGSKQSITSDLIEQTLGLAPSQLINDILDAVEDHDVGKVVQIYNKSIDEGVSPSVLATQLANHIRQQIVEKPDLLDLLDSLIDVDRSSHPQLKLLSVLGQAANNKQTVKTIALSVPTAEVSASIAELEAKASMDNPSESSLWTTTVSGAADKSDDNKDDLQKQQGFDWNRFIDFTQKNYIAIYSVLSKCHYQLDDTELTIYTGNKFYKKKLDDSKYRPLISKSLEATGAYGLNVHTIATAPPPRDSQAAAVVAIMGGGEEVSLESA